MYQLVAKVWTFPSAFFCRVDLIPKATHIYTIQNIWKFCKLMTLSYRNGLCQDLIQTNIVALELLLLLLLLVVLLVLLMLSMFLLLLLFLFLLSVGLVDVVVGVAKVVIVVCRTAVRVERVHDCYQTINFYMVGYLKSTKGLNGWT